MPDDLRFEPFELAVADGHVVRGDLLRGEGPSYVYLHGMGSVRVGEKSTGLAVITDASGSTFTATVGRAGNFGLRAGIKRPYKAKVVANGKERAMIAPQTDGDCNGCHDERGNSGAPGRIFMP